MDYPLMKFDGRHRNAHASPNAAHGEAQSVGETPSRLKGDVAPEQAADTAETVVRDILKRFPRCPDHPFPSRSQIIVVFFTVQRCCVGVLPSPRQACFSRFRLVSFFFPVPLPDHPPTRLPKSAEEPLRLPEKVQTLVSLGAKCEEAMEMQEEHTHTLTHTLHPPTHQSTHPPTHPPTHQPHPPTHQSHPPTHQSHPPTHQSHPPTHQSHPPTHQSHNHRTDNYNQGQRIPYAASGAAR
jgi:hypothetical protein